MSSDVPFAVDLPDAMTTRDQWLCWRVQERDGKETKVPINPHNGSFGSATTPDSWATFETAREYAVDGAADGIGYVFTDDGPLVGVDLDDCRDPETGELTDTAVEIVEELASYTEVSPSGTGVHVIVEGTLPGNRNRRGWIECYETARYFTVTGDHVEGTPATVEARRAQLRLVYGEHVQEVPEREPEPEFNSESESESESDPEPEAGAGSDARTGADAGTSTNPNGATGTDGASSTDPSGVETPVDEADEGPTAEATEAESEAGNETRGDDTAAGPEAVSDAELVDRAHAAKNGDKFARLWNGDTSGYESHSEADMALCALLAFWTGRDRERIDRLFRQSGLMRPKWDERHYADGSTYGEVTIERVVASTDEVYDPDYSDGDAGDRDASRAADGRSNTGADESPAGGRTSRHVRDGQARGRARSRETGIDRLAIIADLQTQVERLVEENERLRAELEDLREREPESESEAPTPTPSLATRLRRWLGRDDEHGDESGTHD